MTGPSSIRPAPPPALFRASVVASTWALPRGSVRDRYRQELLAELYASAPQDRARYTVGVVTRAWVLRIALKDEEPVAKETTMHTKPFTCRLNLHHVWHTYSTEDGNRYLRCARCGKEYTGGGGSGGMTAAAGGG
jgi:hypothetical protein